MSVRAVLDTSALIGRDRHELVFNSRQGYYEIVWSAFIISEFTRVRQRLALKHGQPEPEYRAAINASIRELASLTAYADYTLLTGGNYDQWLKDPDDEPILATALVGGASYIVSTNTHDYPPGDVFAGVRYLTPRAFLDWLYSQYPDGQPLEDWQASGYRLP